MESVYYTVFSADDLCICCFKIILSSEFFGLEEHFSDIRRLWYQMIIRWDKGQLYPSTLVQHLSYYLHPQLHLGLGTY